MSTLRERFDKLEPRERRLLTALLGILGAFVLLLGPILLVTTVSSKRSDNQELRDLIETIRESRGKVAERKAKHDALLAKYGRPAPALAGFIESVATANGMTIPESQDRPEMPHGKRYNERSTVVKLHKVGMLALAKTLEKIEQSGHPVSISRLNLKPRPGEPDSYEVELGVSAFDRKPDAPAGGAAAAAPSASAKATDDEEIP
jgi:general secretion pathway protein M